jgi:hypothetical protein
VASVASDAVQIASWTVGSTIAATVTARCYRRRSASIGMVPRYRRYWLLWLAITVGAFTVPAVGPAVAKQTAAKQTAAKQTAAWTTVLALGYALMAVMGRSTHLAILAGMLGATSAVLTAVSAPAATADVTCGFILVIAGLAARGADHAP